MSDLVKIARARVTDIQSTHWEGCERDHRECLIQRMADEIERLTAENRHLRQTVTGSVSAALHDAALAELRGENERLREQLSTAMMDGHDLAKHEYRDEIERLTKAAMKLSKKQKHCKEKREI